MIIACPACATRYVVPDSAIGPEGRTVRCAKCRHSWFQHGPELVEPIAAAYGAPAPPLDGAATPPSRPRATPPEAPARRPEPAEESPAPPSRAPAGPQSPAPQPGDGPQSPAEPTIRPAFAAPPAPASFPREAEAEAPPLPRPELDEVSPPPGRPAEDADAAVDPGAEVSHFDRAVPFTRRRNWLRWLTWGAGAFAVLALAAVAAISMLGVPSWLPIEKPLFGADPGLKVEFPASEQERRTLPNGAEFFGARVVVKNETRQTRRVPPLLIVLRDARERVVYSWELVPPQRSLAPGEAMTINEAMTDVPKSAVYADIGWAPR